MQFNPKISPSIIPNIASTYTNPYRVIMEYIDNSIDAASLSFDKSTQRINYQRDAKITVTSKGKRASDSLITIKDNCKGIPDLKAILESIGSSNKKAQSWTNGQFGFGIYSFMAICENLEIRTKTIKDEYVKVVNISRRDFNQSDISNVMIQVTYERDFKAEDSFTEVKLSKFDKDKWEEFEMEDLAADVQKHFEPVLKKSPVKIELNHKNLTWFCYGFNYILLEGDVFEKDIEIITPKTKQVKKAKIFLKYTSKRAINKPIVFFSKDRRICDVNKTKSFDSNNMRMIWSNPQLTGFIDTVDILDPLITRDSFKNALETKRLFSKVRETEPEILAFINECNKKNLNNHFEKIENMINDKISDLVINKNKMKRKPVPGDMVTISNNSNDPEMECIEYQKDLSEEESFGRHGHNPILNKNGVIDTDVEQLITADSYEIKLLHVKDVIAESPVYKIKIEGDNEPLLDSEGNPILSLLNNNVIIIYKKHKDFEQRIKKNSLREEFITSSLLSLIIIEFLSYTFKTDEDDEPKDIKKFKEFYYKMENELKELDGEPLVSHV